MEKSPVIIALDLPSQQEAENFLDRFQGAEKPFIKIGYQLFYRVGPTWVREKKEQGYSIFLDLKLHDIPNTVQKGVSSLLELGIDFLTIHAAGGSEMIRAAREVIDQAQSNLQLLAVTQLTSTDQTMLNNELGIPGTIAESVVNYALLAEKAGAHGVICSAQEAKSIKKSTSGSFLAVTPGIRLAGTDVQDQKRVMTPALAIENGADYLVVGRPITQAADPVAVYQGILEQI
ncbi:orotidine-5'-phosphate decarboxylase [Risungbinella massiliensis]|uniref:orotidine-5'-phosphate decarboxylase n=1 Tax=Risungbinella massiliensis TaxID=1329796 RepID=UPI0005CBA645|nr:orotidine-5'-phosphate decarboxylase [Risungbinella massiliensis]